MKVPKQPMTMITYRQLAEQIATFNEEQLNANVTIFDPFEDEYFSEKVELVFTTEECGVLDPNHPILRF
jgi:hypothetical protein